MSTLKPRLYRGLEDLERISQFLSNARQIAPHAGYIHPGDIHWWVFYDTSGVPATEKIWIWEHNNELIAWAYFWPRTTDFEYFIAPHLPGTPAEIDIITWLETHIRERIDHWPDANKKPPEWSTFTSDEDTTTVSLLTARGYTPVPYMPYFTQSLDNELHLPVLPQGFHLLDKMKPEYADKRADVHLNAFNPSKMTTDYYRKFMESPRYDPTLDTVVVGPDGRFAAFAMAWVDDVTGLGVFEPVGTRHEWQRKGLGRAAILEGLRRMQARGMHTATVCTWHEDTGNIAFYQSCGFEIRNRLQRFRRKLR